jgi:FkbM family methyltransferase
MRTQRIKSWLIEIFGDKFMAYVQALRFVYLLNINRPGRDPELAIIHRFLTKGDIAIDIGANGADWTYHLHHCVGEEGYIYAFEADPYYALATDIAIKLMRLKRVRLFSFGLSKIDEWVPIRVTDSHGLRFSGQSYVDKNACKNDKEVRVVHLKKLDSMIQDYPQILNTALIKCDVEGYELFVFEGANEVLSQARPFIILEVGNYWKQGYSSHDVYNLFT